MHSRVIVRLSSTIQLNTCTTLITDSFCCLYLLPLFGLPIYYYVSQGSTCLPDSEDCCSAYQQWLSILKTTTTRRSSTELQTYESNSTQVTNSPVVTLPSPPHFPRESLLKLEQAWNSYLDSRLAEWRAIFTLACVFIAWVHPICDLNIISSSKYSIESISVTTFQIPQVIDDPLTRFFASLAVYRAFTGLIYTPIFSLYFNSKFARSVHFAFLLSKVCWIDSVPSVAHRHYSRKDWSSTVHGLYYHFLLPPQCGEKFICLWPQ